MLILLHELTISSGRRLYNDEITDLATEKATLIRLANTRYGYFDLNRQRLTAFLPLGASGSFPVRFGPPQENDIAQHEQSAEVLVASRCAFTDLHQGTSMPLQIRFRLSESSCVKPGEIFRKDLPALTSTQAKPYCVRRCPSFHKQTSRHSS